MKRNPKKSRRTIRQWLGLEITIDLDKLVERAVDDPEARITQIYCWRYSYSTFAGRTLVAFGFGIIVAVLAHLIKEGAQEGSWEEVVTILLSLPIILLGFKIHYPSKLVRSYQRELESLANKRVAFGRRSS